MNAGDTFLIPLPGTSLDSHLWMVISDPMRDPEHVVLVNLTSWRADKDQACIVLPGDHPYLTKKSCVNFRGSKVQRVSDLESLLTSSQLTSHAPLSTALLARIRCAVADSRMPLEHAAILADQGLVGF